MSDKRQLNSERLLMEFAFVRPGAIAPGALVVGVLEGGVLTEAAAAADSATDGAVKRAVAVSRFKGQAGHSLELLAPAGVKASRIILAARRKKFPARSEPRSPTDSGRSSPSTRSAG